MVSQCATTASLEKFSTVGWMKIEKSELVTPFMVRQAHYEQK